ncbi:MAG: ParB/RepB/Spo0J family partition protein [Lachnospiraceae bacterium]|nr:ParB/RepB/Spo0J family partition protein [Lachnospiraceae bacterium]
MSNPLTGKIKLSTYSELVGDAGDEIIDVPLSELHDFHNHPFKVTDGDSMQELTESIRKNGVLVPAIARRKKDGGYELVSGHRRKRACELAGLPTMPVIVKEYTDDEAVIVMVDANIQREDILPSEKAKAYRMKYETMKHQGMRSGGLSLDSLGAAAGESGKTVQRYLWLSRLIDGLMELVDRRKMTLVCGIDLSWLSQEAQSWVFECLSKGMKINKQKTERLKVYSERGDLTEDGVINILSDQREKPRSFVMSEDVVRRYFGDKYTVEEMTSIICELLKEWKQRECTDI